MANQNYQAIKKSSGTKLGIGSLTLSGLNSLNSNSNLNGNLTIGHPMGAIGGAGINIQSQLSPDLFNDHVKRYEVFETPVDILVLSATLHRLKSEANVAIPVQLYTTKLTDKSLFESVTEQDKEYAAKLREYYSKKFLWWTLNEVRLSAFRQDLKNLINSDGKIFKENIIPLAYRMPEFYEYDMAFEKLSSNHNQIIKTNKRKSGEVTLNHVGTFIRNRRHMKSYEYWFTDNNDNLNMIVISKDNPLKSLLDLVITKPITVGGLFTTKTRDNKEYFVLEKYSFS